MDAPETKKGFFRRLFTWRGMLFSLAALITLIALFVAEEDWRGARAWHNYKRDMEAKGERFDIARLIPPPIPDAQNLAETPFFNDTNINNAPAYEFEKVPMTWVSNQTASWRFAQDCDLAFWKDLFQVTIASEREAASAVLTNINRFIPNLGQSESNLAHPAWRFYVDYEKFGDWRSSAKIAAQSAAARQLTRMLSARAAAELAAGRPAQGLLDVDQMFNLDQGIMDEPIIISQLVANTMIGGVLYPIGGGLAQHQWSEDQLQQLQKRLLGLDLIGAANRAFYGERDICVNAAFDNGYYAGRAFNLVPAGWIRLEQLSLNRCVTDFVLPRINVPARIISPAENRRIDSAVHEYTTGSDFTASFVHHNLVARRSMLPTVTFERIAFAQTGLDLAAVACALERFRLAESHYPEQLHELVPRFMETLPHDIINGQPLKYRRTDDGRFVLYSVGWNEKDDGGVAGRKKDKTRDLDQGDWVWEYPKSE